MKRFSQIIVVFTLLFFFFVLFPDFVFATDTWTATGALSPGRNSSTATVLESGKVLINGGETTVPVNWANLYDPSTGIWSLGPDMLNRRSGHTSTILPDGRVLVTGGKGTASYIQTAEVYNPVTNSWAFATPMNSARFLHTATLLNDGRVLVAGGFFNGSAITDVEIFDPIANTWSSVSSLPVAKRDHTATLLPDGKVLVAGGSGPTTAAFVYDPVNDSWSSAGNLSFIRSDPAAILLNDGRVLVIGGGTSARCSAEIWLPDVNQWTIIQQPNYCREVHSAIKLADGTVFVMGGFGGEYLNSTEIYNPVTGQWTITASMINPRANFPSVMLEDGTVLVAGGVNTTGNIAASEIYSPNIVTPTPTPTLTPFLNLPWDYEGKGLSFNEGALAINSYFDHEYPLLSSSLSEPASASGTIVSYLGLPRVDRPYSMHDGYDYGRTAQARIGDFVLAAASGSATFVNTCNACGNAIHIDHGNGYQTRYYHLQKDGLIATVSGQPVLVDSRQAIGKVGFSGNVIPKGENGAHIHFMVVHDKDEDGDFDNNIPDGMTDPYGWQSDDPDPWDTYPFFYNELERAGSRSYYLWRNQLDGLSANFSSNGGIFSAGRYTVSIPQDATNQDITLEMQASPIVKANDSLISIGSAMNITAIDTLSNSTALFVEPLTITIDFSQFDLSRFKSDTISIYSSADNINWVEQASFIDYLSKKATTEVSHLTYFAVIAERADTIAPTTTAILDGQQGEQNWFRGDVVVNLNAQDNENGLGVDYTLYKTEGNDWQQYSTPLLFANEGHHRIEFYSVDNDENIEEIKSVEFDIDKTKPEIKVDANPNTIWPPNGKMVDITITGTISDENPYVTTIFVEDEYNLVEPSITTFETEINQTIRLEAFRREEDKEGRIYTIKILATDLAGNTSLASVEVLVLHDQRK